MGIALLFQLVVVDQRHIRGMAALKTENDAPVGAHCDRPISRPFALERVQTIPRKIESLGDGTGIPTWTTDRVELYLRGSA